MNRSTFRSYHEDHTTKKQCMSVVGVDVVQNESHMGSGWTQDVVSSVLDIPSSVMVSIPMLFQSQFLL